MHVPCAVFLFNFTHFVGTFDSTLSLAVIEGGATLRWNREVTVAAPACVASLSSGFRPLDPVLLWEAGFLIIPSAQPIVGRDRSIRENACCVHIQRVQNQRLMRRFTTGKV